MADATNGTPGNPNEPEYEFEDPAQAWIALVEACRILDVDKRKQALTIMLNEAKSSHWSEELYDTELELQGSWEGNPNPAEYGGPFPGDSDTEEQLSQDGKDQQEIAGGLPATPPASQARTKVTARQSGLTCFRCGRPIQYCPCYRGAASPHGYVCPKCGVFVNTGQCHTCHL